jgi:beta-glucosidase
MRYIHLFFGLGVVFFGCTQMSSTIQTPTIQVPHNFLWGTGVSEYQVSGAQGCPLSNWADFEATYNKNGTPHIAHNQKSGSACDFKNLYRMYIPIMKELGTNAFRFSVEWSNIEPQEGVFDESELAYYDDLCDALLQAGITPMITLHHFTDPLWFTKKGGFEREENTIYFVRFCQKVFERLGNKVRFWITINEPTIYMFQGYLRGVFPQQKINPFLGIRVMRNLLEAHTKTYRALKKMPHGVEAQIGIVHQYLMFYPYGTWNPLERIPGLMFNYILNTAVLNFFRTGIFRIKIPFILNCEYQAPYDQNLLDFIGLNYYSRVIVKGQLSFTEPIVPSCYPDEIMTDMPYAMYPQGLYDAIAQVADLEVPIYITENGIPDEKDDRREQFIADYLAAMSRAINDGFDVRGYFYWSLMDNFEWDEGYLKKFGLCHVDFETKQATIRDGARIYAKIIAQSNALHTSFIAPESYIQQQY